MYVPKISAWFRLDDDSRVKLLNGAKREIARRALPGALIYFCSIAVLLVASSTLQDHPQLTAAALALTLIGGIVRCFAAFRVLRSEVPDPAWMLVMRSATLLTMGTWGVFCATTMYFNPNTWASTYLLIAGASLAGGAVARHAGDLSSGLWALLLIVAPTGVAGMLLGSAEPRILGISAFVYMVFLMVQLHQSWADYWKMATAPALDAMVSRLAAMQSDIRFQTLFEDAPSGIYLAFPDDRVEMANSALAQMLGYSGPAEIAGRNLEEFTPSSERVGVRNLIERQGYVAGRESDWRRKDGARIRVRESVRVVQAGTHSQSCALGIVEDVTTEFVAEQSRRQLIEILESTSDFVERIAATGETLYVNGATRRLLGEPAGSLQSAWNRAGDAEVRKSRLNFADEAGIWQGESWLLGSAGNPVPVSQVIISHRSGGRVTHSYSIISRDISAARQAQEALRSTEEQLIQAQRLESVGRLAGGIAHDFNNLLTVIMGYASFLEGAVAGTEAWEGVIEIGKAAEQAAELTRQLLAFGRKQVLSKKVIDVRDTVRNAEKLLRRTIGRRIELVTKTGDEPQTVVADAAQLEQVLVNLILNGRDAMPNGGVATIETATVQASIWPAGPAAVREGLPGEYVRISVSDTGIGMDEDTKARVFEPFFTTKVSGRGSGLGLATAYGFISQSGGSISVSSKPGAGTTFEILLPRCTASAAPAMAQTVLANPGGSERILLADDEPALRGLLRHTLAGHGYRVAEAKDGADALSQALDAIQPFDLLLTDVIMPGMTGPELAGRMKTACPGIAVLFISGYPGETEADRARFGPGAAYLPKPFTAETLLRAVRQQLDGRRGVIAKIL